MPYVDLVSRSAIISVLGQHGRGIHVLEHFKQMLEAGKLPDRVTCTAILDACSCSHTGLAEEGLHFFSSLYRAHGITLNGHDYVYLIDLLCRAGKF